jgi:hypothetical protein
MLAARRATCRNRGKAETLALKMVAKIMAQRPKKRPKRGNALLDRRAHPDADELIVKMVIPK